MISPQNTISYYKNVLHTSGNQAETSVRLFMAPGMDHCGGGEGPFAFDMDDALSQWVEQDKAPALIVAAHLSADPAAHAPDRTLSSDAMQVQLLKSKINESNVRTSTLSDRLS